MAYVGVPKVNRKNKLHLKAKRGIMIGYGLRTKGYRIYFEDTGRVIETINVSFNEELSPERCSINEEIVLEFSKWGRRWIQVGGIPE